MRTELLQDSVIWGERGYANVLDKMPKTLRAIFCKRSDAVGHWVTVLARHPWDPRREWLYCPYRPSYPLERNL